MTSLLYAVNIGTLATWLSVAGFGTIGLVLPDTLEIQNSPESMDPYADLESTVMPADFNLGDTPPTQENDTSSTGEAVDTEVPFAAQETLPIPPEMPEVTEASPLPEIPDMPLPVSKSNESIAPAPTKARAIPVINSNPAIRSNGPTRAAGGSPQGKPEAKGTAVKGGRSGGSGISDAKRLAGGRMPAPSYPSEARAKGHTGTVLVEFVVGETGSVVSAYAKNPSPWPVLNERAVSAVRRWRFPPGRVAKYTRPIVFTLN